MPKFNAAFWKWFGDSKVVDRHGNPRVVYHGTRSSFSVFSSDIGPHRGGLLAFASESPKFASGYAMRGEEYDEGSAVMPVYLSIQRPFDYRRHLEVAVDYYEIGGGPADSWELDRLTADYYRVFEENLTDNQREQYGTTQFVKQVKRGAWLPLEIPSFVYYVRSLGFDGIRMREMRSTTWAVFDPTQIKSAIGNDGSWDADDPDIRSNPGTRPVPPQALSEAFEWLEQGGRLVVRTRTHMTIIDKKTLRRFQKADAWLLRQEGDGYRMQTGNKSVYLLPGQLEYVIED